MFSLGSRASVTEITTMGNRGRMAWCVGRRAVQPKGIQSPPLHVVHTPRAGDGAGRWRCVQSRLDPRTTWHLVDSECKKIPGQKRVNPCVSQHRRGLRGPTQGLHTELCTEHVGNDDFHNFVSRLKPTAQVRPEKSSPRTHVSLSGRRRAGLARPLGGRYTRGPTWFSRRPLCPAAGYNPAAKARALS